MFTETDSGKADDVLLVDFQMCIWAPAVIDLIYMLYMMLNDYDRIHRRKEITHYYFEIFTETLKTSKFTGEYPKLVELYKDFITYKDFGEYLKDKSINNIFIIFVFRIANAHNNATIHHGY